MRTADFRRSEYIILGPNGSGMPGWVLRSQGSGQGAAARKRPKWASVEKDFNTYTLQACLFAAFTNVLVE